MPPREVAAVNSRSLECFVASARSQRRNCEARLEMPYTQAQLAPQRRFQWPRKSLTRPPSLGFDNPMGTDGFEFVEYTAPDIEAAAARCSTKMGFTRDRPAHAARTSPLLPQGDINFIINAEPDSLRASDLRAAHGPSACAMAFRVQGREGRARARDQARRQPTSTVEARADGELEHPGDQGHRRHRDLYLRRPLRRHGTSIYDVDFEPHARLAQRMADPAGFGLTYIDHLTHNVHPRPHGRSGPTSTSGSSTSARSATSTSRASRPACSPRR